MKRVLFAAGGTMGHIGPAIAVAEAVKAIAPDSIITFVGSKSEVERTLHLDFPHHKIIKVPLPRKIGFETLIFPFKFTVAVLQSLPLVRQADVVVGFGGYVATPVYLASRLLGRRVILHEANALPGFANRLGRAIGAECFANFEEVGKAWSCQVIGMPLRSAIIEVAKQSHLGTSHGRKVVVMGGSQGSTRINKVIWDSLPHLDPSLEILHAVGPKNLNDLKGVTSRSGYQAVAFIDDVAKAYKDADLVIARAGAVTCAEIVALRKRAILVPLGHGNGEQTINARSLVEKGLAISVGESEFNREWLTANIDRAFALRPTVNAAPLLEATEIMARSILSEAGVRR